MEKYFLSYDLSLKLKDLGFNQKDNNFGFYDTKGNFQIFHRPDYIVAPIWEQAFDFFREKYNIIHYITYVLSKKKWNVEINSLLHNHDIEYSKNNNSYEEARESSLHLLIESVNTTKNLFAPDRWINK